MGLFVDLEDDENENKVDRRAFRKGIFALKLAKIGRIFVIIAIIAAFFIYRWVVKNNQVFTEYQVVNTVECNQAENSKVLSFQNMFLTYSIDGIHCTDAKGKDIWSTPFEMQNPIVNMCGAYVAVADYNGRNVFIFNAGGELGNIKTTAPIKNVVVSGSGTVAVVTDDDKQTPINLYYYDGRQIATFRTTMSKSGYPIALGISDDSKLLVVSYLYLDNGILMDRVAFYNFGEVGQNESDNLVSGYDYQDEIVPVVGFLNNSVAYAVANDKLLFYEGKERPSNTDNIMLYENIQAVYTGDNCVALLYYDTTGSARYRLDVYNKEKKESSIYFNQEFSDIFLANGMVVIYNPVEALIYTQTGNIKFDGQFKDNVKLMIPTNSYSRYVLVHNDCIETINLK